MYRCISANNDVHTNMIKYVHKFGDTGSIPINCGPWAPTTEHIDVRRHPVKRRLIAHSPCGFMGKSMGSLSQREMNGNFDCMYSHETNKRTFMKQDMGGS